MFGHLFAWFFRDGCYWLGGQRPTRNMVALHRRRHVRHTLAVFNASAGCYPCNPCIGFVCTQDKQQLQHLPLGVTNNLHP